MSETDDQVTPCEHRRIVTFANPDASIRMWACEDCRRRFYPACYVCIDNGHRSGLHPDEAATPAAEPEPTRDDLIATLEYAAGEFRRLDRPNSALAIEETLAGRGGLANLGRATTPAAEPDLRARIEALKWPTKPDDYELVDGWYKHNAAIEEVLELLTPAAEPGLTQQVINVLDDTPVDAIEEVMRQHGPDGFTEQIADWLARVPGALKAADATPAPEPPAHRHDNRDDGRCLSCIAEGRRVQVAFEREFAEGGTKP